MIGENSEGNGGDVTKRDKKKTKDSFFELVGKFNAIESCCKCHPHGEWDDCDYSPKSTSPCKRTCANMKLQKLVIMMMWEYMRVWYFVPITKTKRRVAK